MTNHYQPRHSGHDDDEQQLANLILLLRLPHSSSSSCAANDANIDDDEPAADDDATVAATIPTTTTALRTELERNGCQLLRFMERLVRQYYGGGSKTAAVVDGGSEISKAYYAYLCLAVRIAYLRYASQSSSSSSSRLIENHGQSKAQTTGKLKNVESDDRDVRKCEFRLLNSLLAVLQGRPIIIDDTLSIEASWVVEGLLVKLSSLSSDFTDSLNTKVPWNIAIRTLLQHRREKEWRGGSGGAEEPLSSLSSSSHVKDDAAVHPSSSHQLTDTQMMIQTIHSILDRFSNVSTCTPDWEFQLDASLLSCLNSFLDRFEYHGEQGHERQKLTQDVLFGLIHWSQEKHPFSLAVYLLVNMYLRICIERYDNDDYVDDPTHGSLTHFRDSFVLAREREVEYQNESLNDDNLTVKEFAIAIRSFLFYGLLVLCNAELPGESLFLKTSITDVSSRDNSPTALRRGDVFSMLLNLWTCFGVDWLFVCHSKMRGVVSPFWWLSSEDSKTNDQRSLGPTWPLCMLIRLAVGEFRLGLGRYMSLIEVGGMQNLDEKDSSGLVVDILVCSQVISQSMHLMTSLVDDEGDIAILSPWSPDAVLHIRTSLEDALNSSMQYLTIFSGDLNSSKDISLVKDDDVSHLGSQDYIEIWRACCRITGTITDDLDVDQLLALSSAESTVSNHRSLDGENSVPCIVVALRSGIQFSNSLAERQCLSDLNCEESLELEPLVYLLPSTMSLVSHLAFNDDDEVSSNMARVLKVAKQAFSTDDWLLFAISSFLCRLSNDWIEFCRGCETIPSIECLVIRRTNSVVSVVDMCIVIISSLGCIAASTHKVNCAAPSKRVDLNTALDRWKKHLKDIAEWENGELRCSAAETLEKVSLQ